MSTMKTISTPLTLGPPNAAPGTAGGTSKIPPGGGPKGSAVWRITQISITCSSSVQTQAQVFLNGDLICSTNTGNADTAAGSPAHYLRYGDQIEVTWSGGVAGATAQALFFYDQVAG
jgi:hypothetical protein